MSEEISEAYTVTKAPLIARIVNISLILIIFFGTSGFLLYSFSKDNDLKDIIWALALLLIGCYMLWKNLRPVNKRSLSGTWISQQRAINKNNIYLTLLLGIFSIGTLLWLLFKFSEYDDLQGMVIFALAIVLSVLGIYLYQEIKPKKVFVLSEAAQFEQLRLQSEKAIIDEENAQKNIEALKKQALLESKWWYRYGVATLILFGAGWMYEAKPNLWWVSGIAVLVAMIYAWELLLLIIGGVVIWFAYQGLASLSVTGAIIFGACIIAYAIINNK